MSTTPEQSDRLDSWKEIAAYVGRDVRTVIRWEQKGGLPVYRIPVGQRQAVYAFKHEIDAWMIGEVPGSFELGAALETAAARPEWSRTAMAPANSGEVAISASAAVVKSLPLPSGRVLSGLVAITGLLTGAFFLYSSLAPRSISLQSETQLTDDGASKSSVVTDGAHLYFNERRAGRDVLSVVSMTGGPIQEVATPFVEAQPLAVGEGGRELLILAGEGEEKERALWILPLPSGKPWRVGNLLCHTASWSPDGKAIAYSSGSSVYLTTDKGATSHLLEAFTAVPQVLRWSLNGTRILTQVRDPRTWVSTFWELALGGTEATTVEALIPLHVPAADYGDMSPVLDDRDDALVSFERTILMLRRGRFPWQSGFFLTNVRSGLNPVGGLTVDETATRVYGLKSSTGRTELVWFNRGSRQFRPFLPGISARDVDFSRNGQRIAYVRESDNTLWTALLDGSSAQQIPTPGMVNLELPRWSPDGKTIAFMGAYANAPHRIYTSEAAGGPLHEASIGTDNQGAPTWSPDGKYLVYGRVMCQEEKGCAIVQINFRTGEQAIVPGSEGLGTARWSPSGRFVAALRPDRQQVVVLDRNSGEWRVIADGVNGNDLAWSADSQTLYASRPYGDRPQVVRIGLADGKMDPAVDLSDFSKLSGRIDTWFAVTPDDSILFLHVISGSEIVALNYTLN